MFEIIWNKLNEIILYFKKIYMHTYMHAYNHGLRVRILQK